MNTNQKMGRLIQEVRQHRGLTQAELATMMNTSQSAINRIENGNQNLSLETIKRLSHALQQPFLNFNEHKVSLRIHGGKTLSGQIKIKSAKNTTLGILFASLINHGKTTIKNAVKVEEIFRIIEVLDSIGVSCRWIKNDLEIKRPPQLEISNLNIESATKTRSAIMLISILATEMKTFNIPFSGGCHLGKRSIIAHIYALEELGIKIVTKQDHYQITSKLKAKDQTIIMYESGDTATINTILVASKLDSTTVIKMASANYQVEDVCLFLQNLGIKIEGIGTTTLTIHGHSKIIKKDVIHQPLEDPIEAMTLISAAITTNSQIIIKRVPLDFLELEILKIKKMNCKIEVLKEYKAFNKYSKLADIIIYKHNGKMIAPIDKISCRPYPGVNIDNLPYFVPIAATAKGQTLIHDWVYENRAIYYTELSRIGASISLADPHRVYVNGPTNWQPTDLSCPPAIRPATINLIGMLAADGVSTLRNIYTINRGYENIAQTFNSLGAKIEIIKDI